MSDALFLWLALFGQTEIPAGPGRIEVPTGGFSIEVFTHKPAAYRDGPLIFVFHGVLRNADVYRDHAQPLGDRLGALIAAPKFDLERFPIPAYQMGNILKDGMPVPRDRWTGALVPQIAAEIRRRERRPEMPYYLLGHSGGGQFLVRLAGFVDTGAARIVAGNPGTHLWPSRAEPFPYGFGALPEEISDDRAIRRYLAQPLTIYLGTADTMVDEYLDQRPEAIRQGASRLERGRNVFEFARKLTQEKGWAFHWRLAEAPHVPHDHGRMFDDPHSSAALFGLNPAFVVGHRGLLQEAPENTLANFRACLELGLGFEFDVQRTSDGHLVCLHDDEVDRTTDGTGKLSGLTLEEIRKLDAGRWFATEFTGERVPTVDEVFALLAARPQARVLVAVDIKGTDSRIEADLVASADRHKVLDRLVFIGRTIEQAEVRRRLKQANTKVRVARLVPAAADLAAATDDPSVDWLYMRFIPTAEQVLRAETAGKRLFIAGPLVAGKEPASWRAAANAGFDGILTDHPLELRRTLNGGASAP